VLESIMPTLEMKQRQFDARPDRVDFRDHYFYARLVSLEPEHPHPSLVEKYLTKYCNDGMILDQGQEGACTGFGLAACINYLNWERWQRSGGNGKPPVKVSTRMLYHMAKLYDEWSGEDYDGSSCRGAMKGWHHHGVCDEERWPYRKRFVKPKEGWEQDAATRPLGAYYRVNKDSIVDMQAAIQEVHAIYASATVHEGWWLKTSEGLPVIDMAGAKEAGGHAFALVGYNAEGFIIQNSWGPGWGYRGFAVLPYDDWVKHGMDAWVAVLGAPVVLRASAIALNRTPLQQQATAAPDGRVRLAGGRQSYTYKHTEVAPWSNDQAYEHSIVLGNDGQPLQRLIGCEDAAASLAEVALERPRKWLAGRDKKKLVIYAHGGLNHEEASIGRIRIMAPYFKANGIYPLFVTWRTGFGESLRGILEDEAKELGIDLELLRARGMFDDIRDAILEAKDRAFEAAAEKILAKAVWTQMKQNAAAAAIAGGGLRQLAGHLEALRAEVGQSLEIHLLGHSAGAILLGHLIDRMVSRKIDVASLGLYAPACTMAFAAEFVGRALQAKRLNRRKFYIELLSDRRERDDTVGPYGKSLLYLVSRALEEVHKTPLLGLIAAWNPDDPGDIVNVRRRREVAAWRKVWGNASLPKPHGDPQVSDGQGPIPIAHGSFDNDVGVVTSSIELILGGPLAFPVENLRGF
jgi:alpha-beta hydrolase superfamily lysophospholipase